jgi:hypothetical protein
LPGAAAVRLLTLETTMAMATTMMPGASQKSLSNNATYQQWVNKTDEIIAYCEENPGSTNNTLIKVEVEIIKEEVETMMSFNPWAYSDWNSADWQGAVSILNHLIDQLE